MSRTSMFIRTLKTILVVMLIASIAAAFAWSFRELILTTLDVLFGDRSSIHTVRNTDRVVVFFAITVALGAARWIGTRDRAQNDRVEGSLLRAVGTFVASITAGSIGRETAIIDTGRSMGAATGTRLGFDREAMAMVGVAAAFAAAYHAPFAAAIYVASHFRHRRDVRILAHAMAGALVGDLVMVDLFNGHPLFPRMNASLSDIIFLGAIGFLPAVVGARLFLWMREEVLRSGFIRRNQRTVVPLFIVTSAACVAVAPLAAGNGMEALRNVAVGISATSALSLSIAKLIATAGAVGSRTPGGIFSPTLAVSAGWAALSFTALDGLGIHLPASAWPGLLIAMAVGATIGLRSRLLGAVVIAEMIGQIQYVPVFALFAIVAGWFAGREAIDS